MASIQKHGDKWRVFVQHDGKVKTKVCRTKTEARQWAEDTASEMRKYKPGAAISLHDALDRYAEEVTPTHKGAKWEIIRLAKLKREIKDKRLSDITKHDISEWRDAKTISPASVLREMNILHAFLEHCRRDWGYINENPMLDVKRPIAPPARRRGVTQDEIDQVCKKLNYAEDLPIIQKKQEVAVLFMLAIETAMRKGEMLGLTPDRIHLERRVVELEATKNGDKRRVPLSTRAVELLKKLPTGCFTVSNTSADTLFREARPEGLHFHDSRSEGITRLAKKLDVLDLARAIGHRDPKSLMLYYRETAEQLAAKLD